mmetsp:Transcript_45509/g.114626  ORF Transcript_45509/g.114626 Transcript_45509/m.114626 type:complete len:91 (+) Transcript_45509:1481-1753(+)
MGRLVPPPAKAPTLSQCWVVVAQGVDEVAASQTAATFLEVAISQAVARHPEAAIPWRVSQSWGSSKLPGTRRQPVRDRVLTIAAWGLETI